MTYPQLLGVPGLETGEESRSWKTQALSSELCSQNTGWSEFLSHLRYVLQKPILNDSKIHHQENPRR